MTAEQQLERSVLEGKEREELSAIAQAMSLKTNSRTKKADIIDQILDATGVTSGSQAASNGDGEGGDTNGVKPSRRTRSVSASASSGSDEAADTVAGSPSAGAGDATPTTAPVDSEGAGSEESAGGTPSAGVTATAEASSSRPSTHSGPAIFVEPPDLATGTE